MEERFRRLERSVSWLKIYAVGVTMLLALVILLGANEKGAEAKVLRARGLVLIDDAGRERILIGAPIPDAANRGRTDAERVAELWGQRFPKEYMDYYKAYNHATNGIVILDENGFDQIAIGDPVPDPNIGKRIAPSTGMIINDDQGFERSGYGILDFGDSKHVTLGLDTAHGTEGLILTVRDDGGSGILISDKNWSAFLGSAPDGFFGNETEALKGLRLQEGDQAIRSFTATPPVTNEASAE